MSTQTDAIAAAMHEAAARGVDEITKTLVGKVIAGRLEVDRAIGIARRMNELVEARMREAARDAVMSGLDAEAAGESIRTALRRVYTDAATA